MSIETVDVTVCVPTIPEREELRAECFASIEAQIVKPAKLLYEIDHNHRGVVPTMNSIASRVETTWLHPFGDDDLMDPEHFQVLAPHLTEDYDLVYTWCRITGYMWPEQAQIRPEERPGMWEDLRRSNFILGAACIRTSLWNALGGYREDDDTDGHEDWGFNIRALDAGCRFHCIPQVTLTYRMDQDWTHLSERFISAAKLLEF